MPSLLFPNNISSTLDTAIISTGDLQLFILIGQQAADKSLIGSDFGGSGRVGKSVLMYVASHRKPPSYAAAAGLSTAATARLSLK